MVHAEVVKKISGHFAELMVAKIESMTDSWRQPWISRQELPYNLASGRVYTGMNILTLLMLAEVKGYRTPVYLTFRQAKELGLRIRKGAKQFPVVFWKPFYMAIIPLEDKPRYLSVEDYNDLPAVDRDGYKLQFSLRFYSVLNLDQTDFSERYPLRWQQVLDRQFHSHRPAGSAHAFLDGVLESQTWVCPIHEEAGDRAFYSLAGDVVVVPCRRQFIDLESFYSTLLHEMCHSTGSTGRLNRHFEDRSRLAYGREELVAEFSAALVGYGLGVSGGIRAENVSYLKDWLDSIRKEPNFVFSVLNDALQIVRFVEKHFGFDLFADVS